MIKITADSTADLDYLFKEKSIPVMPLCVTLDGANYRDGVDITSQMIYDTYDEKKILPKTAAPGIEDFVQFFENLTKDGSEVIHISISGELSASCQNALQASKNFNGVYVVDSRVLSSGIGLLVLKALELKDKGLSAKEIVDRITALTPYGQTSFMVETLTFLHKGGRCSALTMIVGSVLRIRPVLELKDGKITVGHKFLGSFKKNIAKYVETMLRCNNNPDYTRIFITHAGADEEKIEETKRQIRLQAPRFKEILVTEAGATIAAHCGRGTLGILYINKPDDTQ